MSAKPSEPCPCLPRVSILASDLSERGAGRWGGGVRPFLLGQGLQQAGYGVEIIGFTPAGDNRFEPSPVPVRVIPIDSPWPNPGDVQTLLQQLRGDVIYAYKLKPSSLGLALLHRLKHRRPVILDIDDWELSWHGGDRYRYRPSLRQLGHDVFNPEGALRNPDHPLYLQWIERLATRADLITTHSTYLQQRFGGVYVPNGKDTDQFNPDRYNADQCRREYGLASYRVLMFPGAPRPYKGVEDLLLALDRLDADDLKLVIVGGSPYDDYDQYLLTRWPDRIIHLGKHPPAAMPKLVAAAHVVVLPQRQTPAAQAQFPLKITDGMAMAKPILATEVGDIPAILSNTGYLVEPEAPDQLAAAITVIFEDYGRAVDLGWLARERCVKHYSINVMGQILRRILQPFQCQNS